MSAQSTPWAATGSPVACSTASAKPDCQTSAQLLPSASKGQVTGPPALATASWRQRWSDHARAPAASAAAARSAGFPGRSAGGGSGGGFWRDFCFATREG